MSDEMQQTKELAGKCIWVAIVCSIGAQFYINLGVIAIVAAIFAVGCTIEVSVKEHNNGAH